MKKHNYCLLILFFFCGWVFGRHVEIPDLQLSELNCNQYSQVQPTMVELENCAPVELDIGGYCLTDSEGLTYTFPDETKVSPGGLVVVVMEDSEEVDFPMNEEAIWLFCTEPWRDDFLQKCDWEECALVRSTAKTPDSLIDFLQWGNVHGRLRVF